jgi:hypothetical protein
MTCQLCAVRYALAHPVQVASGERLLLCIACAAQLAVPPRRFPEGTQRTDRMQHVQPANDFIDHERETLAREVEVAQGRAAVLAMMLRRMVDAFPELNYGLTSAAQQQVLRDVRAVLEESK